MAGKGIFPISVFIQGMVLGAAMALMLSKALPAAEAQEPAENDAQIESADWGVQRVSARSGQRITSRLSLSEVNRISVEGDRVAGVRAAQNGVPGAPAVEFDRDEQTGDLYVVVTSGQPDQVVSAFISTERRNTYHVLFTIKNQPGSQLFISNIDEQPGGSVQLTGGPRSQSYQDLVTRFAAAAFESMPIESTGRDRSIRLSDTVSLEPKGIIEEGQLRARFFDLINNGATSFALDHHAFIADGVLAVASAYDEAPAYSTIRVITVERVMSDE
jgi:hypothetical protein